VKLQASSVWSQHLHLISTLCYQPASYHSMNQTYLQLHFLLLVFWLDVAVLLVFFNLLT
jgi:hypothetical protein